MDTLPQSLQARFFPSSAFDEDAISLRERPIRLLQFGHVKAPPEVVNRGALRAMPSEICSGACSGAYSAASDRNVRYRPHGDSKVSPSFDEPNVHLLVA